MRVELRTQNQKPMRKALVRKPLDGVEGDDGVGEQAEKPSDINTQKGQGLFQEAVPEDAYADG